MTENRAGPGDLETAYFYPSIKTNDDVVCQDVAIAPLKNREASIVFSVLWKEHHSSYVHLIFTEQEVDILINALQECKVRWDRGLVIE
jgi:hypothetical protein